MPQGPNLRPDQIKALVENGDISMTSGYAGLTDAELKIAMPLMLEKAQSSGEMKQPGVDWTATAPALALGAPGIGGAIGKALPMAKNVGGGLAAGLGMGLGNWLMQKMGVPAEGRNAVTMGAGFALMGKGAAKGGAAAEGAVLSAEEAAIAKGLQQKGYPPALIEKILAADKGKGGPVMPLAAGSNVIKEGPLTGVTSDVSKGFHPGGGLFEFPGKGGQVADEAGFQRALEEELNWIQKQKGLTNSNATTSTYDQWVAQQESKFPPTGTSIKDLATKGSASLRKPK